MNVLVTGSDGYIGSVMVPMLIHKGHKVTKIDTHFYNENNKSKDIRNITEKDLKNIDAVIHLASLSNDPLGDINPELTYEINTKATIRLAKLSKELGVKRFLYSSSCSVYGASKEGEWLDETSPLNPVSNYAISKINSEEGLMILADKEFSPIFLRNSTAYGYSPNFRVDLVLNRLVARAFTTGRIPVMGSGNAWRPIVHIEDISQVFIDILDVDRNLIHNQVINVGINIENYRVIDIANIIKSIVPMLEIEFVSREQADPRSYRVSFDKLNKLLPTLSLKWNVVKGIEQLYISYLETKLKAEDVDGRKFNRLAQLKYLLENKLLDEKLYWRNND